MDTAAERGASLYTGGRMAAVIVDCLASQMASRVALTIASDRTCQQQATYIFLRATRTTFLSFFGPFSCALFDAS